MKHEMPPIIIGLLLLFCLGACHAPKMPVSSDPPPVIPPRVTVDGELVLDANLIGVSRGWLLLDHKYFVFLPPEPEYVFEDAGSILYRLTPGGGRVPWAVRATISLDTDPWSRHDPLAQLTKAEARQLHGYHVQLGKDIPEPDWDRLDWENCALQAHYFYHAQGKLDGLPPGVRYLKVDSGGSGCLVDVSGLTRLEKLRFLDMRTIKDDDVRGAYLGPARGLEHFRDWGRVHDLQDGGPWPSLTVLDLGSAWKLGEGQFLTRFPNLRQLQVRESDLTSLAALDSCPRVREVDAGKCLLDGLPRGHLPDLEVFNLIGAQYPAADLDTLRARNPGAAFLLTYEDALARYLKQADTVRIYLSYQPESGTPDIHREEDAAAVRELIASIEIQDDRSGWTCMCVGSIWLDFLAKGRLLGTLSVHHGRSLRWRQGPWPGDASLTRSAALAMGQWLARRGAASPLREFQESEARP